MLVKTWRFQYFFLILKPLFQALIHVSTIYTFFNCEVIEEKVFSMPIDYEHLLKLVDSELEATETE